MDIYPKPSVLRTVHNGIPVVRLACGPYEADICPDMGANCIRFSRAGVNVLRTPPSYEIFKAQPNVYGMPLLFPPNRIGGGSYTFQGREYRFPINEPAKGHHIHGFLSQTPFLQAEPQACAKWAEAEFSASFGNGSPYLSFPHAFSVRLCFRLDGSGLIQTLTVKNDSRLDMPCGLGFHTAFALPFLPGTREEDYALGVQVGDELCLDPLSILPTGETLPASSVGQALRESRLSPGAFPLSNHFAARSGAIVLRHLPTSATVQYLPDPAFSFLMLWNCEGHSGFVCPEPQTWQINAPNSSAPPEKSGFRALEPGQTFTLLSRLAMDPGSL